MLYYAGIGSRNCSRVYYDIMVRIGEFLASNDYVLRSGGAFGSDSAFETGCDNVHGTKQIFLPWKGFNDKFGIVVHNQRAWQLARKFHPNFDNLSAGAKSLHARNSCQIFGENVLFKDKVRFVVCYTEHGKMSGGTSQALRIAKHYNIPIFNIGSYKPDNAYDCFIKFFNAINK